MNRSALKKELDRLGISKAVYSLYGGYPDEGYVLNYADGRWEVYCSERGVAQNVVRFGKESEACEHFLKVVTRDPNSYTQNRPPIRRNPKL
jgi:hypothetical protein